ncbi:hypothetical protein ES703_24258 [subsurface metagenome]
MHVAFDLELRHRGGELQLALEANLGGDVGEELVDVCGADLAQHLLSNLPRIRDVWVAHPHQLIRVSLDIPRTPWRLSVA